MSSFTSAAATSCGSRHRYRPRWEARLNNSSAQSSAVTYTQRISDSCLHPGQDRPRGVGASPVPGFSAARDYHWVDGHGKPYVDAEGHADGLIAALRVVDDRVEVEQKLERLARFDTLTGLANRGEAIARLESALEHPPAFGVHVGILFCDVDHFKDINDTWGHVIGDTVLATLAARIRESVRQEDTVGRTGGDEVLVVLPGLRGIDQLAHISEKIRSRAAEPIHESGQTIRATLSIGATIAVPGETVSSVIARADAAMYQNKLGDRNAALVEPGRVALLREVPGPRVGGKT